MGYSVPTPNFTTKINNTARCALHWRFLHTHKEKKPDGGHTLVLRPNNEHILGSFTQREKETLLEQWASSQQEVSSTIAVYKEHVIQAPTTTQVGDRTSFSVHFSEDSGRSR